jgi:hypothetical protein
MSSAYTSIAESARKILEVLGPTRIGGAKLALSGQSPDFPGINLKAMLSATDYGHHSTVTKSRIATIVGDSIKSQQLRLTRQYWLMAEQLCLPAHSGLSDIEMETQLVQMFEYRWRQFLYDVRRTLQRVLARENYIAIDRNTRGGFGDVSPPSSLEANKFSKPSESSKQHSTTRNPPSQQK